MFIYDDNHTKCLMKVFHELSEAEVRILVMYSSDIANKDIVFKSRCRDCDEFDDRGSGDAGY